MEADLSEAFPSPSQASISQSPILSPTDAAHSVGLRPEQGLGVLVDNGVAPACVGLCRKLGGLGPALTAGSQRLPQSRTAELHYVASVESRQSSGDFAQSLWVGGLSIAVNRRNLGKISCRAGRISAKRSFIIALGTMISRHRKEFFIAR